MYTLFAFVLAIGVGFGLACLIFASLLFKSNDLGDSVGKAELYTSGIDYDYHHCYDEENSPIKIVIPPEYFQLNIPPDNKKVEITQKDTH